MLLSRLTLGSVVIIYLCLSSALAKEVFSVGQINAISYSNKEMIISDSSYRYGNYLVIQRYGSNENQRLPESYLTAGMWVLFHAEFDGSLRDPEIKAVRIFDSESQAQSFYKGEN